MFKYILQIIPNLDPKALADMDRALTKRFTSLAKKFGKGLVAALTGGGIAGFALGMIDKILNPLKETQEAIDATLMRSDDLVTNAKQFNTTAGKLFRLQQLAKSTGLDEGSLFMLMSKFQTALAEGEADKTKDTSVRQFVGDTDIADSFFQFIQSLQKMEKSQQIIVQQEVFGEKQILKMADFLQTDFAAQTKLIGGPSAEKLNPGLEKLGNLNDLKDALEARRILNDTFKKSQLITESMIKSQDERARLDLEKENQQIKSYNDLAAISIAAAEITNLVKQGVLGLTGMIVKVTDMANNIKKIAESRPVKGLMKIFGKE